MSEYVDNHPLGRDFPELKNRIHELKVENAHFRTLMERYESTDRDVVRAEQGLDHLSDQALEALKFERVKLKDELYAALIG
ncbi:MAG: YdcH family protein [Burkholderiaceae bacterium]